MHKKVRRHSALLLLMAPVLALGSTFLVAGSANASVKPKNVKPTITICKAVAGSFHFSINGKTMAISKACVTVTGKVGANHVTETWAPASYRNLTSISVSPKSARVSSSVHTASAVVELSAHSSATVKFVNAKVVTEVVSKSGTLQPATGSLEVCKASTDNWVEGDFGFTISSGGTSQVTPGVPVGQCSSEYTVDAGTVTVSEGDYYPYEVDGATTYPEFLVGTVNAGAGGGATVTVNAGAYVTLYIWNGTALSYYKMCKTLADNQGSLAGSTFSYDTSWVFTPSNGAAPISSGNIVLSVTADPAGETACSGIEGAPAGAIVTASEVAFPDVVVTGTPAISGNASSNTSSGTTAVFGLPTGANTGSVASATFTNDPMGWIEVCKYYYDDVPTNTTAPTTPASRRSSRSTVGRPSRFRVELARPRSKSRQERLPSPRRSTLASTSGTSRPTARMTFSASRLLSSDIANPASVTVPYGGVGNETVVTFIDAVDPTQFKICKQETSADAALSGDWFTFDYAFSDGNYPAIGGEGSVSLQIAPITASNPTGLVCSGMIYGPPASTRPGTASLSRSSRRARPLRTWKSPASATRAAVKFCTTARTVETRRLSSPTTPMAPRSASTRFTRRTRSRFRPSTW